MAQAVLLDRLDPDRKSRIFEPAIWLARLLGVVKGLHSEKKRNGNIGRNGHLDLSKMQKSKQKARNGRIGDSGK
jgi:hypothetical protein